MITKAEILALSTHLNLLNTIVQKDYVIGWLLRGFSQHGVLSEWIFKGGTCLKKCYFETYRFSEDLDFTVPAHQKIDVPFLETHLNEMAEWVESNCGLTFPREVWKIEAYENTRGKMSYQVKLPFSGPLGLSKNQLQRVKLDITQDELLVSQPVRRNLHHDYSDKTMPMSEVLCYSIEEVLAEKTRALFERSGRARDVYDVVNISRHFRSEIDPDQVIHIAKEKFRFKGISEPTVDLIMNSLDIATLGANWKHQLAHQINLLPAVETFIEDLSDALAWWLEPKKAKPDLQQNPSAVGRLMERVMFPEVSVQRGLSAMDQIRYAARNRFCAVVSYHGSTRLVIPYSVRYPSAGNPLLHAWELMNDGKAINDHRAYKIDEITEASVSTETFVPKWSVEL